LQRILGSIPVDGKIGLVTLTATSHRDAKGLIKAIYKERMAFLRQLKTWPTFGAGWSSRCTRGEQLALRLADRYPVKPKIEPAKPNLPPVDVIPANHEDKTLDGAAKAPADEPVINPPSKSKTVWGGILGFFTGASAMVSAVFEHINNKYALIGLAGFGLVGAVSLWLVVKGRIDIGKVAEHFKEEAE
jgi:hypothetical protein